MTTTANRPISAEERRVILASSLGTIFEWYDFYLYGALAPIIAKQFFTGLDEATGFIFALLTFAAGFIVRPFGALVFGRLGDMVGRKYTFLITILIMGSSTFIVGILPNYASIGVAAPVVLIGLRLLQGLALGGEYGGAATYVAEHAPAGRRGTYTAWIQTTATLGLLMSLMVILGTRTSVGEAAFAEWGWRVPFIVSIVMLIISVFIRLTMNESPAFVKMKSEGKTSKAPLTEAFGQWKNLKVVIVALVGLTAGQAVVWYTGQFYALFFLTQVLKVNEATAIIMVAVSLVIGTPFFVVFGALSDKIGRKPIILAGCFLAAVTYLPVFKTLTQAANPDLAAAQSAAKVVVVADPAECAFQFNPTETQKFQSSCDIAKQQLSNASVSYTHETAAAGTPAIIRVGDTVVQVKYTAQDIAAARAQANAKVAELSAAQPSNAQALAQASKWARDLSQDKTVESTLLSVKLSGALSAAGYPARADMAKFDAITVTVLLTYLVILVTMVYGPIAATLVEMFPTRIRYTAMSLPYHIGNGWFGGLLPTTAFAIVAHTGDMYNGLWYPIIIAGITVVVGMLFVKETKDVDIYAED